MPPRSAERGASVTVEAALPPRSVEARGAFGVSRQAARSARCAQGRVGAIVGERCGACSIASSLVVHGEDLQTRGHQSFPRGASRAFDLFTSEHSNLVFEGVGCARRSKSCVGRRRGLATPRSVRIFLTAGRKVSGCFWQYFLKRERRVLLTLGGQSFLPSVVAGIFVASVRKLSGVGARSNTGLTPFEGSRCDPPRVPEGAFLERARLPASRDRRLSRRRLVCPPFGHFTEKALQRAGLHGAASWCVWGEVRCTV